MSPTKHCLAATLLALCTVRSVCGFLLEHSTGAPLDVDVVMSSYLGGGTEATTVEAMTVAMDNNGTVFVGGKGKYNFGLTPVVLQQGGDGFVLELSNGGTTASKLYRYGMEVNRLVIREKGGARRILIQSDQGLALFHTDLDHLLWEKPMACPRGQCYSDVGRDGTVAVVLAPETGEGTPVFTVQCFAVDGSTIGSVSDPEKIGDVLTDVAVDPLHKQIIIVSYYQRGELKIPCVIALDYTGHTENWHDYCVTEEEMKGSGNTAACWINRVHYSDFDDRLYVAANTHGGNNVLRYDPLKIRANQGLLNGLSPTAVAGWDPYTQTWGMHHHTHISFLARYTPGDGALDIARYFITRRPHTNPPAGGDLVSTDISAGPEGRVVVAQDASEAIEHRDSLTVNHQHLAPFTNYTYEAVLLGLPQDLNRRLVWHHFATQPGESHSLAVAANRLNGHTRVAFLAYSNENQFVTVRPLAGTGRVPASTINQYVLILLQMSS